MNMHHLRKRRQFRVISAFVLVIGIFVLLAPMVLAVDPPGPLPPPGPITGAQIADVPGQAGLILPATDPRVIVAKIIKVALGFLGIVAVGLILYGGFLWMTSAGDEEKIAQAKKVIINATIGLAIILAALGIVQFIFRALTGGPSAPLPPPLAAAGRVGGGALGSGIVESHYPMRGASGVFRNTRLIVTFKEAIDPESLAELIPEVVPSNTPIMSQTPEGAYKYPTFELDHDGKAETPPVPVSALRLKRAPGSAGLPSAVQIIKTEDIKGTVRDSEGAKYLGSDASAADVLVMFTEDLRTFIFTPVKRASRTQRDLFGSATADVGYTVYLCGTAPDKGRCQNGGIKLRSGIPAFQGYFKDYQWSFTTGTLVDTTPPEVVSVMQVPDQAKDIQADCPAGKWSAREQICDRRDKPRNSMLQVNFSEAVLPTVASGRVVTLNAGGAAAVSGAFKPGTYTLMKVSTPGPTYLAGEWKLGNQYRTAEFVSADLCGRNSCGQDVFCLPAREEILGQIASASLLSPGDFTSAGRFDGLEDVAGNALDGNADGTAQGPVTDFDKNIPNVTPKGGDNLRWSFFTGANLDLLPPVITDTVPNISQAGTAISDPIEVDFNKPMAATTLNSSAINLEGHDTITGGLWDTWWTIESALLDQNQDEDPDGARAKIMHGGLWEKTNYASNVSSAVKDLLQNCYLPSAGAEGPGGRGCAPQQLSLACRYCCNGAPSSTACANPTRCP